MAPFVRIGFSISMKDLQVGVKWFLSCYTLLRVSNEYICCYQVYLASPHITCSPVTPNALTSPEFTEQNTVAAAWGQRYLCVCRTRETATCLSLSTQIV